MSELVVLAFPTETGAREMEEILIGLQKQELIKLEHIHPFEATVILTSLSEADEAKLRAAFHHDVYA